MVATVINDIDRNNKICLELLHDFKKGTGFSNSEKENNELKLGGI